MFGFSYNWILLFIRKVHHFVVVVVCSVVVYSRTGWLSQVLCCNTDNDGLPSPNRIKIVCVRKE